jgi:hypothetical protein
MKKIAYQTSETTTIVRKGYVEIDEDFTQVYKSFANISIKINNGASWKLLFYLISEANDMNGIDISNIAYKRFVKFLQGRGADAISQPTYYRCVKELLLAGAITKVGKGHYYLNPYIFWQSSKDNREEFLRLEMSDNGYNSVNPIKLIS